jgi:hypothetical protein
MLKNTRTEETNLSPDEINEIDFPEIDISKAIINTTLGTHETETLEKEIKH